MVPSNGTKGLPPRHRPRSRSRPKSADTGRVNVQVDIHKLIEAERRSFDEEPYVALRRLLKLPEAAREQAKPAGRAWQSEGVTLEHGSKLRMTYGRPKRTYTGVILNGRLRLERHQEKHHQELHPTPTSPPRYKFGKLVSRLFGLLRS